MVLLVDVVEREVDVGLAGQVDVRREGVLNLAAATIVGLSVQEFAVDQRLDGLAIDELLGDVQAATHVPLGRFNAGLGDDHPVEVGVAARVIIIHGAIGVAGEVLESPAIRDRAFGSGFKGLNPDGGRQGDVAGGRRGEGVLGLPGSGSFSVIDPHRMLGTRLEEPGRVIGDLGGPVGLGDRRGHRSAVEGQLDRRRSNRAGRSVVDHGRDHDARRHLFGTDARIQQGDIRRGRRGDLAVGLHATVAIDEDTPIRIANRGGEPRAVRTTVTLLPNQPEGIQTRLGHGEIEDAVASAAAALVLAEHDGAGLIAGILAHGHPEAVVGVDDHAVGAGLQLEPGHHFHGDIVSTSLEARDAREALAGGTSLLVVDGGGLGEGAVGVEGRGSKIDGVGVGLTRLRVDQRASQLRLGAGGAVGQSADGGGGLLHQDRETAVGGRGGAQRVGELRRDSDLRLKTEGPQQGAQGEAFEVLWTHGCYGLCLVATDRVSGLRERNGSRRTVGAGPSLGGSVFVDGFLGLGIAGSGGIGELLEGILLGLEGGRPIGGRDILAVLDALGQGQGIRRVLGGSLGSGVGQGLGLGRAVLGRGHLGLGLTTQGQQEGENGEE